MEKMFANDEVDLKNERGFSLTEVMVAMGISMVFVVAGYQAYNHFSKSANQESSKLGDLAEFNQIAKDMLRFTEGAGISTGFLNLPVRVKDCSNGEPCLVKRVGDSFTTLAENEIPGSMRDKACTQFYREARAKLGQRKAFPGMATVLDKVSFLPDAPVSVNPDQELYAAWKLEDENSPPLMLLKMRQDAPVLPMLRYLVQKARENDSTGIKHSFYEFAGDPDQVKKLLNQPFLIYSSFFNQHYTIQYAADIKHCADDEGWCRDKFQQLSPPNATGPVVPGTVDAIGTMLHTNYPAHVYAIEFRAIDMDGEFFAKIRDRQNLPAQCLSSWDSEKQEPEHYFFPSKAFSVTSSDPVSDLYGTDPLNVLHLNHYYSVKGLESSWNQVVKGQMMALPIDILTYDVIVRGRKPDNSKLLALQASLWQNGNVAKKIKISELKGPFIFTRKLGSSEIGLWYNPLKKRQPAQAVATPSGEQ